MSDSNFQREEIFAKSVRAGKRTYFFDVKSTRANDYYLTITESKRKFGDDGTPVYEKHKIFLYREDFEKFMDGFNECTSKISSLVAENPPIPFEERKPKTADEDSTNPGTKEGSASGFTDVSFDDLK
ncbi:MAG: DUF3276 family protein [Bacteroidetes bacterium]|nr:DUF3276 family protein [Bacteroidota bacterium]